ncbi:hypothetical protein [Clostridium sp.]|uniref:hypothetical protein n=1 Tax=Clostridium sp. TaxID=1506 RepID=UPI0034643816
MAKVIIEVNDLQDNGLIGTVVISKSGRDKGNYYIVIEQIDENYVLLADGNRKTLERPKKKKLRHLNITNDLAEDIKKTLISNKKEVDVIIKKFLKAKGIV